MSREMKHSGIEWIGEIPKEWDLVRAKSLFAQRNSKGNESAVLLSATQKQGMMPQSLLEGVVQVNNNTDLQTFKTVHVNDYVISLRSFQGGFEKSNYEGVCSPAYQVFYNIAPIDHNYYWLLFKSYGFVDKINSLTVGIREGKNIQYKDFANMILAVPPLSEQQKIANYLDKVCGEVDEMIALQEQMIEELKAYIQSKVKEIFDSSMQNEPYSILKLGGLSRLVTKQTGFDYSNTISHALVGELTDDTIPYIQTKHFKDDYWNYNTDYYIPKVIAEKFPKIILNRKCLLFSIVGASIGNVAVFPATITAFLGGAICKVDLIEDRYYEYIKDYMLSFYGQKQITEKINSSAQGTITVQNVRDFRIPLFDNYQVQDRITSEIKSLSQSIGLLIKTKQQKIEELKDYKKSLIYEYVTGKKEVV